MINKSNLAALVMCALAPAVYALTIPTPSALDPRIQTVNFTKDIIQVKVDTGRATEIVLRPGETVKEYLFGDRDAWWYSDRDHIIRIKPKGQIPDTNVRIVTSRGMYWFDLSTAGKGAVAYQLTILYPPDPPVVVAPKIITDDMQAIAEPVNEAELVKTLLNQPLMQATGGATTAIPAATAARQPAMLSAVNPRLQFEKMSALPVKKPSKQQTTWNERYGVMGAAQLEPLFAKDNGDNTFLKFPINQPLPAIFYIAPDGQESRVSTSMQDDIMVVQRVAQRFILRHGELALCLVNLNYNPTGQSTGTMTVSPSVQRVLKEPQL